MYGIDATVDELRLVHWDRVDGPVKVVGVFSFSQFDEVVKLVEILNYEEALSLLRRARELLEVQRPKEERRKTVRRALRESGLRDLARG